VAGVGKVLLSTSAALENFLPENLSPLVEKLINEHNFTHCLAPGTAFGKNVQPRVAGSLDLSMLSDITNVFSEDEFERGIYAGNAVAKVKSADKTKIATVRTTAFDKAAASGGSAEVSTVEFADDAGLSTHVGTEVLESDRPELTAANVVVSGGRALDSAENFNILFDMADTMNAAVGASRAAVDAGYFPNDGQVGQTGKVVAPGLYFAVGISGAIQHVAGMKDSKVIVAINKDPDAPIFQISDYGLVGDLFSIVPELTEKIKAAK